MFLDNMEKPFRIFIIFSYIAIVAALVCLFVVVYNDIKLKNKIMTEYDKCININEDLYCKVK